MTNAKILQHQSDVAEELEAFFNELLFAQLPLEGKQTLYPLMEWFYTGFKYIKAGYQGLADHYFDKGERYSQTLEKDSLTRQIMQIYYLPRKSYYLHKTGDPCAAEKMIFLALEDMRKLESQGLEYVVFFRIQQYHNLARSYFYYGRTGDGIHITANLLVYLLTGRSETLPDLNVSLTMYPEKYEQLYYLTVVQVFFETMNVLAKLSADPGRYANSLLSSVLPAARLFRSLQEEARILQGCILLFEAFYNGEYSRFCREAGEFVSGHPGKYQHYKKTLNIYIDWSKKLLIQPV